MATSTGSVVKRTYGVQCQGQYSLLPFLTLITNVSSSEMCLCKEGKREDVGQGYCENVSILLRILFYPSWGCIGITVSVWLCVHQIFFIPPPLPPPYKYRGVYIRIALSVFMSVHLSASHPVCLPNRVCRISPEPLNHF